MYKKAWCTCKVVVLLIKPIVFLTFSLPSASLDLKVPTNGGKRTRVLLAGDFHDTCYLKWGDLRLLHSQILVHFLRQGKAK